METVTASNDGLTLSNALATWERERSTEELQNFINGRHAALSIVDL